MAACRPPASTPCAPRCARSSAPASPPGRGRACRSGSRRSTRGSPAAGWRRRCTRRRRRRRRPATMPPPPCSSPPLAARFARAGDGGQVLWALARRDLFAPGLALAGLAPDRLLYAECRRDEEVLAVMEEGLRHGGLAAVVGEVGRAAMAATRRLQLAAEEGGTPALMLRRWRKAASDPLAAPSAAVTRWRIACAPSSPLPFAPIAGGRPRPLAGRARPPARRRRLINGSWRPPMPRLASLFLPDLAIDRIRRTERRTASPPERRRRSAWRGDRVLPAARRRLAPRRALGAGGAAAGFVLRRAEGALVTAPRSATANVLAAACPRGARARPRARHAAHPGARSSSPASTSATPIPRATPPGSPASACSPPAAGRRAPPLSGPDGLWLDLTGVAHLFGGERADVRAHPRFLRAALGFAARIAVAGTAGAAHALARFGGEPLDPLPRRPRSRGARAAAARRASARRGRARRRPPARPRDGSAS